VSGKSQIVEGSRIAEWPFACQRAQAGLFSRTG
jgi:hypothetical protein